MSDQLRDSARQEAAYQVSPDRPFSATSRQENLEHLAQEEFDLLVIGGGITGVAIARDAAMRNLRTALVEKDDFGSGTSSRSSRLIHGGIRYLEYYQFKLVFEACRERRTMRQVAPRLVRPLPFLYPLYSGQKPAPWKLRLGLTLYDALGLFRNVQRHRWVEPSEVRQREPLISQQGLLGAARFYDAQADDARLTLTTAKSAHLHGAVTANHVRVVDLMRANGRSTGACLVDQISGGEIETRAKVIVNATGVWGDQVRLMERDCKDRLIRPSKGIHLVVKRERLCSDHAVVFDSPRDGRHVFIIPWDDLALIGTTDTDYDGDTDKPAATADDVAYVLEAARHAFSAAQIDQDTIISTIAGLRPLITASGGSYDVSREHEIIESPGGLITVAGGKLTTHRLMGEQVVDRVQEKLAKTFGLKADCECRTRERLEGAQTEGTLAGSERRTAVARHLVDAYGADAAGIMAYAKKNPGLAERIAPGRPYLMAEVPYAVHNEMALTLSDVLVRRMHLIYETRGGGLSRARAVAEVMAPLLGWDQSEIDRQVSDYTSEVALTQRWREE